MRAFYLVRMGQEEAESIYLEQGREAVPALEERRLVPISLIQNWLSEWDALYRQSEQQKQVFPQDPAVDQEIAERMRRMGSSLFDLLFAHALDPLPLAEGSEDKPYLSIITDAEFAAIPFEIAYQDRFLYQALHVLRQVRGRANETLHQAQQSRQFLMILNPNGAEDIAHYVARESEALRGLFGGKGSLPLRVIHSRNIRKGLLLQEMAAARYIHFAGHSEPDGIPLADGQKLGKEEIRFLNLRHTELVFFNSCFSAGQNRDNSSLVQAFAAAGVKQFIGYSRQIREDIALEAALFLWQNALPKEEYQDYSIPNLSGILDAFREKVQKKHGKGCLAWTILTQYGAHEFNKEYHDVASIEEGTAKTKPRTANLTRQTKALFWGATLLLILSFTGYHWWFLNLHQIDQSFRKELFFALRKENKNASKTSSAKSGDRTSSHPTNGKKHLSHADPHQKKTPEPKQKRKTSQVTRERKKTDPKKTQQNNKLRQRNASKRKETTPLQEITNRYLNTLKAQKELRQIVQKFRTTQHPYYTQQQKEMFLIRVLRSSETNQMKEIRIQNEIP